MLRARVRERGLRHPPSGERAAAARACPWHAGPPWVALGRPGVGLPLSGPEDVPSTREKKKRKKRKRKKEKEKGRRREKERKKKKKEKGGGDPVRGGP